MQGMKLFSRHATERAAHLLNAFPVVVITGARQVGKTTLARLLVEAAGGDYVTLDDLAVADRAARDPRGLVRGAAEGLLAIDEVQLVPDLLREVKLAVDEEPGRRFLLTGSANLLKMKSVTESLAGRSAWLEIGPLSWSELAGMPRPRTIDVAFDTISAEEYAETITTFAGPSDHHALDTARGLIVGGSMPRVLTLDEEMKAVWYEGYRTTFLERDLRQLGNVEDLGDFNRTLALVMHRTANILNMSSLGSDVGITHKTVKRYLGLLETGYQLRLLPPYYANVGKRLVRSPKVFARDAGMASHIMGVRSWQEAVSSGRDGALLETWAIAEVLALDALASRPASAHYWRTSGGAEVDLLLERGESVVGIEVKSRATIRYADTASLRSIREDLGERFKLGIIANLGTEVRVVDDRIVVVPVPMLLGAGSPAIPELVALLRR